MEIDPRDARSITLYKRTTLSVQLILSIFLRSQSGSK